jgi:serine/threonine protein kinase
MGNKGSKSKGKKGSGAMPPLPPEKEGMDPFPKSEDLTENNTVNRELSRKVGLGDFTMLKTVGKGSFGKVMTVRKNDTGRTYAMKVLNKEKVISRKQYQHTLSERRILEDITHPFLVGLHFSFQTRTKLYMVFDFFNGGELYHYISRGKFSEPRAKFYAAEIVLGLKHLHENNIVYRDLKPENLLLDAAGHIKICDFGLSKENVTDDNVKSICGTPEYLAPEVIQRRPYGKTVDWWSLGTLVYEMLAGLPPFYHQNRQVMYRKILRDKLRRHKAMNSESFDLCAGLLNREPTQRLGHNGGNEIMAHPWFKNIDWEKLFKCEIDPPFKPNVAGPDDTSNIDKEFTSIPAMVTPTPANAHLMDPDTFKDFTYIKCGDEILSVREDAEHLSGDKMDGSGAA